MMCHAYVPKLELEHLQQIRQIFVLFGELTVTFTF